ncbi:zinc finger MYM-type protein 1 isoform X2 [Photinus pyralis]|uniref:zinc finger MYM-type protein 1 isoform X2 n=1 Tax=Photinus pyralis TaxID=7054 RepID=UPI0012673D21|nr:zinc finger MYM-type protein 1 isoform X2 [Photinus pyralis]
MEVVFNLVNVKKFFKHSHEEKIELKAKGRPLPDIIIEKTGVSRGKSYTRKFNRDIYLKNEWICGCNKRNALYCFPCLLFGGDKAWTEKGVTDLEHLSSKIKRHENSKSHLHNCMEFALLGSPNITAQLDSAYWLNVQRHNENVSKNRYILSKIINCIKFCGAFELAIRGHDESDASKNPEIFRGLINFSAELDATLSEHLKNSSIFKGPSKETQNDLLQCMLEVCHGQVIEEINNSPCLAIIADETTDVAEKTQLVIIFRYVRDGEPIERFWNYLNPERYDAETLSKTILSVIDPLIQNSPNKLIAQSYDGAAVMSDQTAGVQALIKKKYPFAHYVHCYAHHLNLIMSKAASANSQVRVFFGNLQDIPDFFNNSPRRVEVLNTIVNRRIPHDPTTPWNFNIRTVNVVYEHRTSLIECMHEIEDQFSNSTVCSAAASIRRTLNDPIFIFWLIFFHHVMPHVDILYNQLQQTKIEPNIVRDAIDNFERSIIQVQSNIDNIISESSDILPDEPPEHKRKRSSDSKLDHRIFALEVCDVIINCAKDRFYFKENLVVASLFFSEYFGQYSGKFPEDKLTSVCSFYPTLEKERLQTELSVIYSRNDCRTLNGTFPFLKFLIKNNLGDTFKETKKLLEIIVTTPMTTSEAELCFSTLSQIKTFLRNSMTEDCLTALSMLSIEKRFIAEIDNFNDKVITKFANRKERGIDLIYKK